METHAQDPFRFTESFVISGPEQDLCAGLRQQYCLETSRYEEQGTTKDDVLSYMFRTARI